MDLDLVFLANLVAHKKGGNVFALVPLQLNYLHQGERSAHLTLHSTEYCAGESHLEERACPSSVSSTTVPLQQKSFLKAFRTFL